MDVPVWIWAITVAAVARHALFDFLGHVRTPHVPVLRESALWSAAYVGVAVVFGLLVLVVAGPGHGGEFFAGFITEKSLSVDNLFVFILIMAKFSVPSHLQQTGAALRRVDRPGAARRVHRWPAPRSIANFSLGLLHLRRVPDLHRLEAHPGGALGRRGRRSSRRTAS